MLKYEYVKNIVTIKFILLLFIYIIILFGIIIT